MNMFHSSLQNCKPILGIKEVFKMKSVRIRHFKRRLDYSKYFKCRVIPEKKISNSKARRFIKHHNYSN